MIPSITGAIPQPLDTGLLPYGGWNIPRAENRIDIDKIRYDAGSEGLLTVNYDPLLELVQLLVGPDGPKLEPRARLTIADVGMSRDEASALRASMGAFADDWDNEESPP
jgi:hypothetical protein